jgi:hypothetical protein
MTTLKQSLTKYASMLLLLLGTLMLSVSISNSAFADTPACDGVSCAGKQPCGTKCVCNGNADLCLDNT